MKAYTVELTQEAARSCRAKPTAKLALTLLSMKSGDYIEIVGEDFVYPMVSVLSILRAEGLEIIKQEYDGLIYRILAKKP